ncbi:hypothetical protein B273_1013 [SAR86 cluster bacterium SAR86E]|uniref:Uncharacterized protein n=1 Tax=SAR86 cluster bacterium SAR86E TaxID=1208365 RepID=K6GIM5_9GAMM|nr:hypothetical protein B273_1013 [SAR86 cluster bacterium SAR86E]
MVSFFDILFACNQLDDSFNHASVFLSVERGYAIHRRGVFE